MSTQSYLPSRLSLTFRLPALRAARQRPSPTLTPIDFENGRKVDIVKSPPPLLLLLQEDSFALVCAARRARAPLCSV